MRTLEVISFRGYGYALISESLTDAVHDFLFKRKPSTMGGFAWWKIKVREPDGSIWYIKRRTVA